MNRRGNFFGIILIVMALSFLGGHSSVMIGMEGVLPIVMAETMSDRGANPSSKSVVVDPMAEIREPRQFRYNASGRRDPFLSFVKPDEDLAKGLPPLQSVELSQMKLVGVAWGGSGQGAMVQIAAGKTYPVRVGTRIGMNQGRVKEIGTKEIVVEEAFLNIFGRSDIKRIVMKLYTKKEG
ncbi:MAG: pilus assembly protein PilP [Nitrospirota bacterium]